MADDLNVLIDQLAKLKVELAQATEQLKTFDSQISKGDTNALRGFNESINIVKALNKEISSLENKIHSLDKTRTTSLTGSMSNVIEKDIRKQVEDLVRANLRGTGAATQRGIDKLVDNIIAQRPIAQRPRVGGGQYLTSRPDIREELYATGRGERLTSPLTNLEETYLPLLKQAQEELLRRIPAEKRVTKATDELAKSEEKVEATLDQLFGPMREVLRKQEEAKKVAVVESAPSYTGAIGGTSGATQNLKKQLDDITKSYGPEFTARIQEAIKALNETGKAVNRIDTTKPRKLSDGFERFGFSFKNVIDKTIYPVGTLNLYLDKTGKLLDQLAYKAAKQKPYTPQSLEALVGKTQLQNVLGAAEKSQFDITKLKEVYRQEPTGVTFFKFKDEVEGVTRNLTVGVDKVGKVLTFTNKRLQDFFTAIKNNTAEVLKWSIGASLVYTTLFKVTDLLKVAIDNEARLADITVTLGNAQRDVNDIFEDAAKVAVQTGESINGVLEAYAFAYRAVGGIADPIQRTETANKLLADSVILAKLSILDQAESIDVLSGSLRQLQKPEEDVTEAFARGTDLLDKWISVTNKANVDLGTLSTAFSITSESAENAGLSIEELNAVIASLSEKIGGLGGRETGNAVRALIGGIYQEQASEALRRYGISITDTLGKMRPFLDISKEIFNLYQSGVIDTDELNKLAYILGGGVRRGQQYVAFLTDLKRINEIVEVQTNSQGAAQLALGKKLDTVQTATTNLGNSFQSLAQTLGTSGGLLDLTKGLLSTITTLVDVVNLLSKGLGKITIPAALLAFMSLNFSGAGGALKKAAFAENIAQISSNFGNLISGALIGKGKGPFASQFAYMNRERNILTGGIGGLGSQIGGVIGKNALGVGLGAFPALSRAGAGEWKEAGVDIGGAIVGTLIAGGNPIGGVIGSAIADTFVSETMTYDSDFQNFFSKIFINAKEDVQPEEDKLQKEREDLTSQAFRNAGFGNEFLGILGSRIGAFLSNTALRGYGAITNQEFGKITPEQFALTDKQNRGLFGRIQEANRRTPIEITEETPGVYQAQTDFAKRYKQEFDRLQDELRKETQEKLFSRDIKAKDYLERNLDIQGLDAILSKMYVAFGENFDKINKDINGTGEVFKAFSDIILEGTQEDTQQIDELVTEIFILKKGLEEINKTNGIILFRGDQIGAEEANRILQENITLVTELTNALLKEQTVRRTQLPNTIELDVDKKYLQSIIGEATKQENIYKSFLTADERQKYEAEQELVTNLIKIWDGAGKAFYERITGGPADNFITDAFNKLVEEGKIPELGKGFDFQQFDLPYEKFMNIFNQGYGKLSGALSQAGYTVDEQTQIALFSDGIIKPMKADWKIVQLLLQEILDVEKDQLDGIYNLPTDASFYVPFQGYELGFANKTDQAISDFLDKLKVLGTAIEETGTGISTEKQKIDRRLERDRKTEKVYDFTENTLTKKMPSALTKSGTQTLHYPETVREINIGTIIKDFIDNILSKTIYKLPGLKDPSALSGSVVGGALLRGIANQNTSLKSLFNPDKANLKTETKLSLNINSNIQLVVDGRILANVVKQYLYQDLVASENSTTAITRVIAI